MDLLKQIVARAQSDKQRIVLPEAEEERTLKAADRALQDGLADIILIGNPENIRKEAEEWGLKNIDKATIVDPKNNPRCEEYAEKLAELRKKKGMTIEQARKLVTENNLYLGCMIIKTEGADGQISGALSTTGETLRPALQIIKCAPGISCVSGAMLLLTHEKAMGNDGVIVMGDVAVTPNPTADQLAQIAYTTAQTAHSVAGMTEPYIAMLSYSNFGTDAAGSPVKVHKAVAEMQKVYPDLAIDGEMQVNYALNKQLRDEKYPFSRLKGKDVNTLVFPNLSSANASYKLLQALNPEAEIIGPIQMGLNKPIHFTDSEGSVQDIVNITAVAVIDAYVEKIKNIKQ